MMSDVLQARIDFVRAVSKALDDRGISWAVMHGAEGAAFLELGLMVFALLASQLLLAVIIALNILEAFFIEKHARL